MRVYVWASGRCPGVDADTAHNLAMSPSAAAVHLALSAVFAFEAEHGRWPAPGSAEDLPGLEKHFSALVGDCDAGEEGKNALGEV